jgi:AraC-like DNA-binding protein
MIALDRLPPQAAADEGPEQAMEQATVTVTLSPEALAALCVYLRSGVARGQPFERPLLEAVCVATECPAAAARGGHTALSARVLRKVHEFVEVHLAEDLSVTRIAEAVSLSPHHLGRSFHQATGQSLWQYVLACRARHARRLIETRPLTSLAQIASLCGFDSYSQFIAVFRRLNGVTPGAHRRRRQPR